MVLLREEIWPSQTKTDVKELKLENIDFPVVFKLCFKNSFDLKRLNDAGYSSVWNYFKGMSKFNNSVFGWAGHEQNGSVGPGVTGKQR